MKAPVASRPGAEDFVAKAMHDARSRSSSSVGAEELPAPVRPRKESVSEVRFAFKIFVLFLFGKDLFFKTLKVCFSHCFVFFSH